MSGHAWRPGVDLAVLRRRAALVDAIRAFFAARGILEVDTPALSRYGNPDPNIEPLRVHARLPGAATPAALYLNTSPEFAMKRLLAAGSGPIWQLARVFRDDERGRLHNPEFTMIEWYRPGFDHVDLMAEVAALLAEVAPWPAPRRIGYREAFMTHAGVDPFSAGEQELRAVLAVVAQSEFDGEPRDVLLDALMGLAVAPRLGVDAPVFLTDYPASQAALARIRPGSPPVAERFELFVAGVELANGFHELADAREQRARFERDNALRQGLGRAPVAIDETLIAALESGLGDCAGVALGVDRLLMLLEGADTLDAVLAFPIECA
ncbi:MAG: EF-P lysine aminoacylase EpmA [Gammaproteobacteria bacterium]